MKCWSGSRCRTCPTANVDEMSSGEARRILIGRALVHDPKALVLDEPTVSLDLHATHELLRVISTEAGAQRDEHHRGDAPSAGFIPEIGRVGPDQEGARAAGWDEERGADVRSR